MSFKKTLASLLVTGAVALGVGKVQANPILYDDFSSETLNTQKWEVRQDYEGQPFIADSGVDNLSQNFHAEQKQALGDNRTYLVPTHKFIEGDTFEYDLFYNSGTDFRISMLLVDNKNRMGIVGVPNSPFGKYHIAMNFGNGFIDQTIGCPDGTDAVRRDLIDMTKSHELYIGAAIGGTGHFDYDNFYINTPEPSTLAFLSLGTLGLASVRRKK